MARDPEAERKRKETDERNKAARAKVEQTWPEEWKGASKRARDEAKNGQSGNEKKP